MTPGWNQVAPMIVGQVFPDELIHFSYISDRDGFEKLELWYTTQKHLYKRLEVNGRVEWYRWMPGPEHT